MREEKPLFGNLTYNFGFNGDEYLLSSYFETLQKVILVNFPAQFMSLFVLLNVGIYCNDEMRGTKRHSFFLSILVFENSLCQ